MIRPSTSFHLGEVITGEPQLYVGNPSTLHADSDTETNSVPQPGNSHPLKRFVAAVQRRFRTGPTPEDALATGLGKAFRP
jgi:hypothetical protein